MIHAMAEALYIRTKLDRAHIAELHTRLNVMSAVALVGWVGFVLVLMGV